jgi:hypothetical protein
MFTYQILKANPPVRNSDIILRTNLENGEISSIPMADSNLDYLTYLEWLAKGNEADETPTAD